MEGEKALFKNSNYKKSVDKSKTEKNDNTLEYYILKNHSGSTKWWDEKNLKSGNEKKHEFLKKDIKPSSVIPAIMNKEKILSDNLGYFETSFGSMQIGYKKFKKDKGIAFSIVPDKVKNETNVSEKKLNQPNTYFGGEQKRGQKKFTSSKISFKYDPKTTKVEKLVKDSDGIVDRENELLYSDDKDDEKLEDLKLIRTNNVSQQEKLNKEKENIRDIKKEKKQDNDKLLKEITGFVDKMKKNIIKKKIDPDEAMIRKKRIEELSSMANLEYLSVDDLKNILKEHMKEKDFEKIKKLSKKELIKIIRSLKI
ncbi:MAG: hypothetical protein IJJ04_02465 [Clostridia bacterium]|nr:hypothetical protein [Clostridia bacterium]